MDRIARLARKYAPSLGSPKSAMIAAGVVTLGVTAGTAMATPPDVGAITPAVSIDSIGTAITGGLQSLFQTIVPIALSVALVLGVVGMGLRLLRGRRPA
ncbi:MAG: hypothetical protein ACFCBV_07260 [Phycisphaerales bacterium]